MSIGAHGSGKGLNKWQIAAICLFAGFIISLLIYGYLWRR
jgi:hypothetical protein